MAKQPNRHICLYSCLRRVEHGSTVYLQQVIRVEVQWPSDQHSGLSTGWGYLIVFLEKTFFVSNQMYK